MKNKLLKKDCSIIRILDEREDKVLIIDCIKKTMPYWCEISLLDDYEGCFEEDLGFVIRKEETLSAANKRIMHERYTLIAGVLPFVSDEKNRNMLISKVAEQYNVSKQTIRKYLCLYLVYQDNGYLQYLRPDAQRLKEDYIKTTGDSTFTKHPRLYYTKDEFDIIREKYESNEDEVFTSRINSYIKEADNYTTENKACR